jgi:hypothetical protein
MKLIFWFGIGLLGIGLLSLVFSIPHTVHEGMSAGGTSIQIQSQYREKLSPIVSAALIVCGAGMMIATRSAVRRELS